jgi:hypothetical protein
VAIRCHTVLRWTDNELETLKREGDRYSAASSQLDGAWTHQSLPVGSPEAGAPDRDGPWPAPQAGAGSRPAPGASARRRPRTEYPAGQRGMTAALRVRVHAPLEAAGWRPARRGVTVTGPGNPGLALSSPRRAGPSACPAGAVRPHVQGHTSGLSQVVRVDGSHGLRLSEAECTHSIRGPSYVG